jgi:hypothetical protein
LIVPTLKGGILVALRRPFLLQPGLLAVARLTSCPQSFNVCTYPEATSCLNPSARKLRAAFKSLKCGVWHPGQVPSRPASESFWFCRLREPSVPCGTYRFFWFSTYCFMTIRGARPLGIQSRICPPRRRPGLQAAKLLAPAKILTPIFFPGPSNHRFAVLPSFQPAGSICTWLSPRHAIC